MRLRILWHMIKKTLLNKQKYITQKKKIKMFKTSEPLCWNIQQFFASILYKESVTDNMDNCFVCLRTDLDF